MKLNEKKDLTRWNRAGLAKFQYIDGNAISYLETLRLQLLQEFDNGTRQQWKELQDRFSIPPNETLRQRNNRLTDQYYDDRRDYAWEILRSLSRSSHVLGEYLNAYANEAYLPTAAEWDNVRKLVALLDYNPAPPASAETSIALLLKEGESGTVDKGFSIKNKPEPGESGVIFETLQKLEGNYLVNNLQVKDWNKNPATLTMNSDNTVSYYIDSLFEDINVGDLGVLATPASGIVVKVSSKNHDSNGDYVKLTLLNGILPANFALYDVTLYLQAEFVSSPLANGSNSASFNIETGLAEQEIIFSKSGSQWTPRQVLKNDFRLIEFNEASSPPQSGDQVFRIQTLKKQSGLVIEGTTVYYLLPEDYSSDQNYFIDKNLNKLSVTVHSGTLGDLDRKYISQNFGDEIYYPGKISQGSVQQADLTDIRFAGKDTKLESASWAILHQADGTVTTSLINNIDTDEDWFSVELENSVDRLELLRSAFKLQLKHIDFDVNKTAAWENNPAPSTVDSTTLLQLDNPDLLQYLSIGQKLICACDEQAVVVELKDIDESNLTVSPPFHQTADAHYFTRNNTVIYANVVKASHGETQAEKIVGNGDASQTSQQFDLTSDKISWIADAAFSNGVRADLIVTVSHRVWLQVEDLSLSTAEDHHYQVRVNEDNLLSLCFGDGKHGRRLPTGIDNVRVRYRNGYGEEGNLPAGALVKIARPHLLVEDFIAPVASSGGAQKESASNMRESAPATVLTLSRAVSLEDFTHLAANHSMVWQAQAFEIMPDRPARSKIEVVIVAAGGKEFLTDSETSSLIRNFLIDHAIPGTPVTVVSYQALYMSLQISIMVDESAFNKKQVEVDVEQHLQAQLDITQRKLGQALFRTEVIALVEQVEGVENAHCEILEDSFSTLPVADKPVFQRGVDGKIRKVSIKRNQLISLDMDQYPVQINSVAYEI